MQSEAGSEWWELQTAAFHSQHSEESSRNYGVFQDIAAENGRLECTRCPEYF